MKKIVSVVLIMVFMFTSTLEVFCASSDTKTELKKNEVLFSGKIKDKNLKSHLERENIPTEVINDILKYAENNKGKDENVQVSVTDSSTGTSTLAENNSEMSASATVYYKSYSTAYYLQPVDVQLNGTTSLAICEIILTSAGTVVKKLGATLSGLTIIECLKDMWGDTAVTPMSDDYTQVTGQIAVRIDKYTYCNISDGGGYRLGLISQVLNNMNLKITAHAFNHKTRAWVNIVTKTYSNQNFVSPNYAIPNVKALSNVKLNKSTDERFILKVGSKSFAIR